MPKFTIKKIETVNVSYSIDADDVEKAIQIAKSGANLDGSSLVIVSATEGVQYIQQVTDAAPSGVSIPASSLVRR